MHIYFQFEIGQNEYNHVLFKNKIYLVCIFILPYCSIRYEFALLLNKIYISKQFSNILLPLSHSYHLLTFFHIFEGIAQCFAQRSLYNKHNLMEQEIDTPYKIFSNLFRPTTYNPYSIKNTNITQGARSLYIDSQKQISIENVDDQSESKSNILFHLSQSAIVRGGFLGAILTGIIGFNAGKYSWLGAVIKRNRFIRNFIMPNKKPYYIPITNYTYPNLSSVTKNFQCFSGQSGIGKSCHFTNVVYIESLIRPTIYLGFKASGINNTFEQDIANKLDYGRGQNPSMFSEILVAVRRINQINTKPYKFWMNLVFTHLSFGFFFHSVITSQVLAQISEGVALGTLSTLYCYYIYMIYPFIRQALRRTKPLIVFDDLNKIDFLNQYDQISRYLMLHDENMGNLILITSDQETWFKLRKQPGLKDRLRQKTVTYDNIVTAKKLINCLEDEKQYTRYIEQNRVSPYFSKEIIIELVKQLIGKRQASLRRFTSILTLNDEEKYEQIVKVLTECQGNLISKESAVVTISNLVQESQVGTICGKLKHIRRDIGTSDEQFIKEMKTLLEKGKLMSDSKLGLELMNYNIVRDSHSEYIFNGKFMYTVFQKAYVQYTNNLKAYYEVQKDQSTTQKNAHEISSS